jgi:hypothetical protein
MHAGKRKMHTKKWKMNTGKIKWRKSCRLFFDKNNIMLSWNIFFWACILLFWHAFYFFGIKIYRHAKWYLRTATFCNLGMQNFFFGLQNPFLGVQNISSFWVNLMFGNNFFWKFSNFLKKVSKSSKLFQKFKNRKTWYGQIMC